MSPQWHVTVAVLVGAVIGSFLNVCIHRLPLRESIVRPGSRCPQCKTAIAWYDNIPILSYLWLRGQCRSCRTRIKWRYPFVEALNAAGYGFIAWRFGVTPVGLMYGALFSALIVVSFIDLDHMVVPDRITLPGIVLGLVAGTLLLPRWWDSIGGLVLGGGLLYVMAWISPYLFGKEGMGGGDIKLLAMIGAFLGWQKVLLTVIVGGLVGSVLGVGLIAARVIVGGLVGSVLGVGLIAARVISRSDYIPFGPFLSLGAVIAMLFGPDILGWYGALLAGRR